MEAKEAIWKRCLEKIEESILPDSYATWFSPTYPSSLDNGLITVTVPNQFYRKCLIENYRELIENTLKAVSGEPIIVTKNPSKWSNKTNSMLLLRKLNL